MAVEFLTSTEKHLLLDLLFDPNVSFIVSEGKLKDIFPSSRYRAVLSELKSLCKDFIASVEGVALIMAIYFVDVMRRNEVLAAKALFFDIFIELETALKKDMFSAEKYKYVYKDMKDAKKSADAIYAEKYRIHSVAKVFAFELLIGSVPADQKASFYVSKKQEDIDILSDSFDQSSSRVKQLLAGLAQSWLSEREKYQCSATLKYGAACNQEPQGRIALLANPVLPKLPSMRIATGEIQLLFPQHSSMLLVDDPAASAMSETTKEMVKSAAKAPLSKPDQDKILQSLTAQEARDIALNTSLLCRIAEQNPKVCGAILMTVPQSTMNFCVQTLLASDVPLENIGQILLHISNLLSQQSVNSFIVRALKDLSDGFSSASDQKSLKSFVSTLHELVTKWQNEKKEICIVDALKSQIDQLIAGSDHSVDMASMWEKIKS